MNYRRALAFTIVLRCWTQDYLEGHKDLKDNYRRPLAVRTICIVEHKTVLIRSCITRESTIQSLTSTMNWLCWACRQQGGLAGHRGLQVIVFVKSGHTKYPVTKICIQSVMFALWPKQIKLLCLDNPIHLLFFLQWLCMNNNNNIMRYRPNR